MRILMITDDIIIDRRIILEAETLTENGHEVIILAGWQEGLCEHEWIGAIKIERVMPRAFLKAFDLRLINYTNKVVGLLNNLAKKIQIFFSKKITNYNQNITKIFYSKSKSQGNELSFSTKLIVHCGHKIRFIGNLFLACLQKSLFLLITFTAYLNHFFVKALRVAARLLSKNRSKREEWLFSKGVYFNPDIIHVHDLPQLKSGVDIKKALKIPLIYDAHEFYPEQPRLSKSSQRYLRKLEKKYINHADLIITVNPMLAKRMQETYHNVQVHVVQNAVSAPKTFDSKVRYNRFREEYNIANDKIILLFQGFIAIGRNLEVIIQAMKYLKDTPFVLLIMGYGDYVNHLIKIVKQEQLELHVIFIPAKTQEDLLFYSASADIGIIPYPYGQDVNTTLVSPNKLYEFIVAGLPILSNDLPFVKTIVNENGIGICTDIQNEERFAEAIRKFPIDELPQFRANVFENKYKFDWLSESKKLLALYEPFLVRKKTIDSTSLQVNCELE